MTDAAHAPRALASVPSANTPTLQRTPSIFEPATLQEAMWLAKTFHASNLLPKGVNSPEAAFTIIVTGHELGLSPMASLRMIHVFDGKPILSAALIVGICMRRADLCEYFTLVESDGALATYETKRRNNPAPTRLTFTNAEAQHLASKDNWKNNRPDMLRARCSAKLARAVYPDIVGGLYDPDEIDEVSTTHVPTIGASIGESIKASERVEQTLEAVSAKSERSAFGDLKKALEAADTSKALADAAARINQAKEAQAIDGSERAALLDIFQARRKELRDAAARAATEAPPAPPPPPPPPAPPSSKPIADVDDSIPFGDEEEGA